jgi:RND family efflux transporter MFP subunit
MTTEHRPQRSPAGIRRRSGSLLFVLIAAVAGLYAGARWHEQLAPIFGLPQHAGGGGGGATGGNAAAPASEQLWTCSMHPQVIQEQPGMCPICHMELTPLVVDAADAGASGPINGSSGGSTRGQAPSTDRKVLYWWDPMMSPPYIADRPGKSPMGMELVPVYADERPSAGAAVVIDPTIVQNMGIRVAPVSEGALRRSIRLVGYLNEAQPRVHEINLRVGGWVRRLHADTEGERIEAGDPLFELYSPELQVGVEELIAARRASESVSGRGESAAASAEAIREAAETKLTLLGLAPQQIEALSRLERAPETITFVSPADGVLTEKMVVEGAAVEAGDRVMRIVDYSMLWLDARAFEKDLPFVELGQAARAEIASRPGEAIEGEVVFIDPRVDEMTRTAVVRLAIPNPGLKLKPGMYATVRLEAELAERAVLVPREAVIDTGERQVAFIAESVGHFEPRSVRVGLSGDDGMVQVLEGLAPGEPVVVSGQFLLDTESRLREAIRKYLSQKQAGAPAEAPEPAHEHAMREPIDVSPEELAAIDALAEAYLGIASVLGAEQESTDPVDFGGLARAAAGLRDAAESEELRAGAAEIAAATDALAGAAIDEQREGFKAVSDGVIRLVELAPPSGAVGEQLYVVHCPMAPGSWLQTSEVVANPYYADSMKRCGSVERTIATRTEAP